MLNKKEGNITGVSKQLNSSQGLATSQAGRQAGAQLASQASSQAGAHLPLGEGSGLVSQAGSQAGTHLLLQEGGSLSSQAGRQSGTNLPFREGSSLASQAGRQAGSNTGSFSPSQGWHFLPGSVVTPNTPAREGPSQAGNNPPLIRQAVNQVLSQA